MTARRPSSSTCSSRTSRSSRITSTMGVRQAAPQARKGNTTSPSQPTHRPRQSRPGR
jgi:hypothetical protein